jgi:hypothetical protein
MFTRDRHLLLSRQKFHLHSIRTAAFKGYCAIWVRRFNFRHQASPRVSPRESTQRWKVELWARNFREFCLNAALRFIFRDLLHAVKPRHGTDGFTSPPKGKNPKASAGCRSANLGAKSQHATSRPPKPLSTFIDNIPLVSDLTRFCHMV